MFRKYKSIKLSYNRQGLIHFTLRNYSRLDAEFQNKIMELIHKAAGDKWKELFHFVTRNETAQAVASKYYLSERCLYDSRKKLYYMMDDIM